ncbi:cobalamin-5'-phosphate synthase [Planifilum fulgidum]|jgi:adenosylcobinamide-GDP ribazoletransferase|uniref:Adenosylcobinamide-GDP ribazoletransferase n=1 Tax=Planifilum fulgidum TaxID=201973 RepID=A0A1I2KFU1_9BACL|nr:adenosylcobinamide-GDP ribazoletransferase [Planifilum fulgidum]SFF64097.1 cobalamin-5'-phosphate synthase [Planifilum fulgidum]
MKPLFYAVAFLTRIPVPLRFDARDRTKSTAYYPLVGLLIGGVIAAFDGLIAVHFPPLVRAVLVTACWVFITGGLHLDGLMDVFDGLGSHREPERMLAIMKDSRVGAMGVLAAVLILLTKIAALASLTASLASSVAAASVSARTAVLLAIAGWPYRREKGIAVGLKEGLTPLRLGFALASGAFLVFIACGAEGVLCLVLGGALVGAFGHVVARRLKGLTGDVYGAMIEGVETAALLLLLWLARL